jgi:hypothetical protein
LDEIGGAVNSQMGNTPIKGRTVMSKSTEEKPKYETPIIVKLDKMDKASGAGVECTTGSIPTDCFTGGNATDICANGGAGVS